MNLVWERLTLSSLPLKEYLSSSYLHKFLVGLLKPWRQSSIFIQWGDIIAVGLLSLVYGLAPFVSSTLMGLLLVACVGLWLLLTLSDDYTSVNAPTATPIHLLVLLYWSIAAISTALSPVKKAALGDLQTLTLYLLLFVLCARVLRVARFRSWLITLYLHISLIVSVYGLRQWFFGAKALATWVDPESPLGWIRKSLALTMFVVNATVLILTFSRGGWIALLVGLLTIAVLLFYWWSIEIPKFWRTWSLPILLGTVVGLLIIGLIFVEPFRVRIVSIFADRKDSSNNFRKNVWESVFQMIRDRPIIGIGPGHGAFNKVYPLYQHSRFTALSAYSVFLETIVETGFLGFTCFMWLIVVALNTGYLQLARLRETKNMEGLWLMGAIAAIIGLLTQGLFDTVFYRPEVNTLWWLMMALIAGYWQPLTRKNLA